MHRYLMLNTIDFDVLPERFILKATHDSGSFVRCRKSNLNLGEIKRKFEVSLSSNYYYGKREWVYKNVKPRILAEPLIEYLGKPDSVEYKLTCCNGKVKFVTVCQGIAHAGFGDRTNNHFDSDFRPMPWYSYYKPAKVLPQKPKQWDALIELAEKLAANIPYVRVDFYIDGEQIYFGEMTFYTWAGYNQFIPERWDLILGDMVKLHGE